MSAPFHLFMSSDCAIAFQTFADSSTPKPNDRDERVAEKVYICNFSHKIFSFFSFVDFFQFFARQEFEREKKKFAKSYKERANEFEPARK
jgi:hypothetical protein